jgi:hypothetical protein
MIGAAPGSSGAGITAPKGFLNASLDDIKIYADAISASQIAQLALGLTPVAHYKLDGDPDDKIGDQDGTENGTPAYAAGKIGQAMVFDGVDDWILVPDGGATEISTGDMAVSLWLKPSLLQGGFKQILINGSCGTEYQAKAAGGGNRYELVYNDTGTGANQGGLVWCLDDEPANGTGTGKTDCRAENLEALYSSDWIHVAVVRDSGVLASIYADGVLLATKPDVATDISSNDEPMMIGAAPGSSGAGITAPKGFLNASLDDIQIFDVLLTIDDINELGEAKGITAHYEFNNDATDTAGGADATEVGTISYVDAKIGLGASMNGDDFVYAADNIGGNEFSTGSFSFSTWWKADLTKGSANQLLCNGSWGDELGHAKPAGGNRFEMWHYDNTGRVGWVLDDDPGDGSGNKTDLSPTIAATLHTDWQHWVGVRDADVNEALLYIDGELIGTLLDQSWNVYSHDEPMSLGAKTQGDPLIPTGHLQSHGVIDDSQFYNYALSALEAKVDDLQAAPGMLLVDLNGDGVVNFLDYAMLADEFLQLKLWPPEL